MFVPKWSVLSAPVENRAVLSRSRDYFRRLVFISFLAILVQPRRQMESAASRCDIPRRVPERPRGACCLGELPDDLCGCVLAGLFDVVSSLSFPA